MSESLSNATSSPAAIVRPHRRAWYELYPFRVILTLLVVVVLHVPFWFMVEKHPAVAPASDEVPPHLVILPPPSGDVSQKKNAASKDLYGWIRLNDPIHWIAPDWDNGFSRYNQSVHLYRLPKFPQMESQLHPLGRILFAPNQLTLIGDSEASDTRTYTMSQFITPVPKIVVSTTTAREIPHTVYWRMADTGERLTQPPQLDEKILELWQKPETKETLKQTTIIEIATLPGVSIPRISIRQRCGNPILDLAARNAVQARLNDTHATPQLFRTPVHLEVDWAF